MATGVIGRRGFTTMQGVIDLMYVCNICPDLLSIDSGRMTGNSEVTPPTTNSTCLVSRTTGLLQAIPPV